VKWSFIIPGQPPSTNHMYLATVVRKADGTSARSVRKADGVESYQVAATLIARAAKPTGWVPEDRIRVIYRFWLKRDIDCDNALKALNDAIAKAIEPNDKLFDKRFLPYVEEKNVSKDFEPGVTVTVMNESEWKQGF
jgi:endodeoxyribonuclease RusA